MQITKLQKTLIIILSILTCIMMTIAFSLYKAMYINPGNLKTHILTLKDSKIPEDLNDVSICYFTDLQYGKFQNEQRTNELFKQIQYLSPDILIFGGDLYDESAKITDQTNAFLTKCFSDIKAPFGKFAVLGEKDKNDEARSNAVNSIYENSQIEILNDKNIKIHSPSKKTIRLIGFSTEPNFDQTLTNLSSEEYNLAFCHYPDILANERLATAPISYALAGHSHGTQMTYPFLGGYKDIENATILNRAQYKKLNFDYIISSGVGTTNIDVRMQAPSEIYYFLLKP